MPSSIFSRRGFLALGPSLALGTTGRAAAQEAPLPLPAYIEAVQPIAFMALREGRTIAEHGDLLRKVSVASVRKSLLGALYGIAVADGRIDPSETLETLGIDDLAPALSLAEKQATIADLLAARSGVYHVAAYETREMKRKRPERGSHAPGSFWFYNNWDFNALGTIYRQQTGEEIFESFERRIARPIGMRDFTVRDGRYVGGQGSQHPAYVFSLTTRDMLRFGEMILADGQWNGRQIVPASWVGRSLTAHSRTPRGDLGYGYLWWVLDPAAFGAGAGFAAGFGGQYIAVVPRHRLVVAQTAVPPAVGGGRTRRFVRLLKGLIAA